MGALSLSHPVSPPLPSANTANSSSQLSVCCFSRFSLITLSIELEDASPSALWSFLD